MTIHCSYNFLSFYITCIHLFLYSYTYFFICPFITSSIHLFLHSSIHPLFHPSIHYFIHPFISSYIHPSIISSIHSLLHASIYFFIHPFITSSILFNVSISFIHLSLYPSIIVFAMFGMLSPASRGALMTASILLFMFMG